MNSKLMNLTYEIELQTGEKLILPESLVQNIGPGRWLVTIKPLIEAKTEFTRGHDAFLKGYAPEDEGLYDDYQSR